jgi:regulator of sigma E protease
MTFKTLHSLFSKTSNISPKHLMGPAGLVKTLHTFAKNSIPWLLWFVILINVNLAILNLLPFPVLDGGIIAIAIIEKITKWKSVDKFFSKIQFIFFGLLLALIIYVTFFDVKRILWANRSTFEEERESRLIIHYGN